MLPILAVIAGIVAIYQLIELLSEKSKGKFIIPTLITTLLLVIMSIGAVLYNKKDSVSVSPHSEEPITMIEQVVDTTEKDVTPLQIDMDYLSKNDVTCSGYLVGVTTNIPYYPDYILDDNFQTAWIENDLNGFGKNEWIQINFDNTYLVNGIKIYNGFHKRLDLLQRNNRIKDIEIVFSDGTSIETILFDSTFEQYDVINFDSSIATKYVRLVIKSVYHYDYSGKECWDDTCITEVILY